MPKKTKMVLMNEFNLIERECVFLFIRREFINTRYRIKIYPQIPNLINQIQANSSKHD